MRWRQAHEPISGSDAARAGPAGGAFVAGGVRAGAGAGYQLAACHLVGAAAAGGAGSTWLCEPGADHPEPGAARAVLPVVADIVGAGRWGDSGAWLSAVGAGADALCDPADLAQRRDGARQSGPRSDRGGGRRRHDRVAEAGDGGGTVGVARPDGGHPHGGRVDDRRGDAVDHGRAAEPGRYDLCRAPDSKLGVSACRVPQCRAARAGGGCPAGGRRTRHCRAPTGPRDWRAGGARSGGAGSTCPCHADGPEKRDGRRERFWRAIYPRAVDRPPAGARRIPRAISRRTRLGGGVWRVGRRRYRHLRRLFGHDLDQRNEAARCPVARGDCRGDWCLGHQDPRYSDARGAGV